MAGESGSFAKLTRDCFLIGLEMIREKSWTALIAPLAPLVPLITFMNYREERAFSARWAAEFCISPNSQTFPLGHHPATCGRGMGMTVARAVWNQIQFERSPPDAPRAPLARPTVVSHLDDRLHAPRRRMALVCARPHLGALRRRTSLRRHWRGRFGRRGGYLFFPRAQTHQPAQKALRNRAALLGVDPAARQILLPLGPLHHRLCGGDFHRTFLSRPLESCWWWRF